MAEKNFVIFNKTRIPKRFFGSCFEKNRFIDKIFQKKHLHFVSNNGKIVLRKYKGLLEG